MLFCSRISEHFFQNACLLSELPTNLELCELDFLFLRTPKTKSHQNKKKELSPNRWCTISQAATVGFAVPCQLFKPDCALDWANILVLTSARRNIRSVACAGWMPPAGRETRPTLLFVWVQATSLGRLAMLRSRWTLCCWLARSKWTVYNVFT